jgi:hypothetical protein
MFLCRSKPLLLIALPLLALRAAAGESHGPYREVSSADPQWRPNGAHLTLGSALHIAEAEAKRNHIHFSDFESPWFWYDCTHSDDGVWVFHYEGMVPAIGNDFIVFVNDRTRHSEYTHGH